MTHAYNPKLDDHCNVWVGDEFEPAPNLIVGEVIAGKQATHGFTNWLPLDKEIIGEWSTSPIVFIILPRRGFRFDLCRLRQARCV